MSILDKLPRREEVDRLWEILPHARLVGGVVRDLLTSRSIADVDLATPEPPEEVAQRLHKANIKVIPTGLAHGTVTAIINGHPYEVTTLRKDVRTDGRHAQVVWTSDWREDAARRDFTINAMFCDREGRIWDFFGGQQDLVDGKIRFVGCAQKRITEDVLRILRFFRFYGRYGKGDADLEALQAIQDSVGLIPGLSSERIWAELQRILTGPRVEIILAIMDQVKVLSALFPVAYNINKFSRLIATGAPNEALLRLAGLVEDKDSIVAKTLRLSNKEKKRLHQLQQSVKYSVQDSDQVLRQFYLDYPLDILLGKSWLQQADEIGQPSEAWDEWRKKVSQLDKPIFPIQGKDLVKLGFSPGPEIGLALQKICKWWKQNGCVANKKECLAWFKEHNNKRMN